MLCFEMSKKEFFPPRRQGLGFLDYGSFKNYRSLKIPALCVSVGRSRLATYEFASHFERLREWPDDY